MVWVVQGEPGAGNGREEVDSSRVETAGVSTLGKGAARGHLLLRPHTPGFLPGLPSLPAQPHWLLGSLVLVSVRMCGSGILQA